MYEERTASRVVDGHRINAITQPDFQPSQRKFDVMQAVSEIFGIKLDEIIYAGGGLRDEARTKLIGIETPIIDDDIFVSATSLIGKPKLKRLNDEAGAIEEINAVFDRLIDAFYDSEDWEEQNKVFFRSGKKAQLSGIWDGKKVDINIINGEVFAPDYAAFADAPINGFAMDHTGTVYTHPKSMKHLKQEKYHIQVNRPYDIARSIDRFLRFKKARFPKLALFTPDGLEVSAATPFDAATKEIDKSGRLLYPGNHGKHGMHKTP